MPIPELYIPSLTQYKRGQRRTLKGTLENYQQEIDSKVRSLEEMGADMGRSSLPIHLELASGEDTGSMIDGDRSISMEIRNLKMLNACLGITLDDMLARAEKSLIRRRSECS